MLDAVHAMTFSAILCGIIWATALGFAAGNYACSLVHRLPRGRLILDKKPYCGSCGTALQVRDLFPVFSALMLRHRCRYCGVKYPVSHTWTELLVGLLYVLAYLQYNFSEQFLLITLVGIFLITLAAIEANERIVMGRIMLCVLVFGALYRTLQDHTIYDFFNGGLVAMIIGAAIWRKKIKMEGHVYILPKIAQLLTIGGVCVGLKGMPLFLILYAIFYAADWLIRKLFRSSNPPLMTVSFGLAVILPVLYPKLEMLLTLAR